jgi:hypothetical protein
MIFYLILYLSYRCEHSEVSGIYPIPCTLLDFEAGECCDFCDHTLDASSSELIFIIL